MHPIFHAHRVGLMKTYNKQKLYMGVHSLTLFVQKSAKRHQYPA